MQTKKFILVDKKEFYGHLFSFIIFPMVLFRGLNRYFDINSALAGITAIFIIICLFVIYFRFLKPDFISPIEVRGKEIRFFKVFPTNWSPIDQYRYYAKELDPKKIYVYQRNCKKIGKIGLMDASPEKKSEFLEIIEPYLTVREVIGTTSK